MSGNYQFVINNFVSYDFGEKMSPYEGRAKWKSK